ncbi:MAG: aminotransferase class V-fold PLP-dependent enzyme [Oscillospiraceae bacterium]|jgi:selenocysteine lyase/cysteine desulfurase|nr:aminotransferase class V-fold PLP-dependent enzyme [Oscillospiraceae bacterium]
MIYLDSAATTLQKPKTVARAMKRAVSTLASPGRGGHLSSMLAARTAYECRELAARLFNVPDPANIVLTSSATHGLNIAINSLARRASRGGAAIVSGYEHNSVMRPLRAAGIETVIARSALFEPEDLLRAFEREFERGRVAFAVLNHVSNVFGYIQPAERVAELCRARGVPLIIDASQSAGSVQIDMLSLGAEFIAMPGHKGLYGPQGTGLLLCRGPADGVLGIMQGGTGSDSASDLMPAFLPDALEAGTHNMPGIAGLSEGIKFVLSRGEAGILEHARGLIAEAARGLAELPGVRVFGGSGENRAGVLSFRLEHTECEAAAEELSRRGFAVRAGLHCAPEAHRTAGTFETGTVRLSVSAYNTARELRALVSAVSEMARKSQ